jgi:hypothetical protein
MRRLTICVALSLLSFMAEALSVVPADATSTARLSSMPVNSSTASMFMGSGFVTAELEGSALRIDGTYEGLNSPATGAFVHRAAKGLRGPRVWDLRVSGGTSGRITGTITLSAAQREELARGHYYIQLHTEQNENGHLRGWLLR